MKKVLSAVMAFVMLAAAMLSMPLIASAESLYIRKIVSVVYDDSGSMEGDKYAYANYAMQAFCGMLNSEDRLFVTYMSNCLLDPDYESQEVELSADGIQDSIDEIENHYGQSSTPFTAVELAYEKLMSVDDTNPNTQYWLVVITDGDFNEFYGMTREDAQVYLNDKFGEYTESVMPNGKNPQITFLGIGDVVSPDENSDKCIFTYSAQSAEEITGAMSGMADKISGRTRLTDSDLKQINDNTIQVSSTIPLLNIAVFAQDSDAKITKAVYANEADIPVSRQASLGFRDYSNLVGGAYLLGDSQSAIGSGIYEITFDKPIELDDVVVLFEPALETRMTITVNGEEIKDYHELYELSEGDKLSASCKIYEMGTDTEIDPSLLPPGTRFELTIFEDGAIAEQSTGEEMALSEYELKNIETELQAEVIIDGFNPIKYSRTFTPEEYVPQIVYSMDASFGSGTRSVKLDEISSNKDLTICFTVYADGVPITDVEAVKALKPEVKASPEGNDGTIEYSDDGKIIFTPNEAVMSTNNGGSFDVEVTCALDNGVSASETYTVLLTNYQVIPIESEESIKKTAFYNNQTGVSFYITKDGVKLDKAGVEGNMTATLNECYSELKTEISIADDGTITVIPYSEEEHKLTFWNWWINWAYYFGLESEDVAVEFNHSYGTASNSIEVTGETVSYLLLNVYLPLALEIIMLTLLVIWIILVVTKPKYGKSAVLYVGDIQYVKSDGIGSHIITNFTNIRLSKYNKIKKGNGRLKFKKTADEIKVSGIKIRADYDGRIICGNEFPWFKGEINMPFGLKNLKTPADILNYFNNHNLLEIKVFSPNVTIDGMNDHTVYPENPFNAEYIVIPSPGGVDVVGAHKVIKSGLIFTYTNN